MNYPSIRSEGILVCWYNTQDHEGYICIRLPSDVVCSGPTKTDSYAAFTPKAQRVPSGWVGVLKTTNTKDTDTGRDVRCPRSISLPQRRRKQRMHETHVNAHSSITMFTFYVLRGFDWRWDLTPAVFLDVLWIMHKSRVDENKQQFAYICHIYAAFGWKPNEKADVVSGGGVYGNCGKSNKLSWFQNVSHLWAISVVYFILHRYHKLQICLRGLFNLYTYDILWPLTSHRIRNNSQEIEENNFQGKKSEESFRRATEEDSSPELVMCDGGM